MKRIVRPIDRNVPVSADRYKPGPEPAVEVTYAVGANLRVMTYCCVEMTCRVVETIQTGGSITYVVVPTGDRKERELRAAGVPVDAAPIDGKFNVFPWQIL